MPVNNVKGANVGGNVLIQPTTAGSYLGKTDPSATLTGPFGGMVYAQTAASTAVSNTITETAFDKSVTIPANTLAAGMVIRVRSQGIATSTNSTDTLTVKLYVGSVNIASTGALDVANNDIFYIDASILVRTAGASGTVVASGVVSIGTEGTATAKPFKLASTTLDTTAAAAVTVKATWSAASASDSVRMDVLEVELF